jgi:hypothetical protein
LRAIGIRDVPLSSVPERPVPEWDQRDSVVAQEWRRGNLLGMEDIKDVLHRQVFAAMLDLHLLQGTLDLAIHLPRPAARFMGFFIITLPPFLYPGLGLGFGGGLSP